MIAKQQKAVGIGATLAVALAAGAYFFGVAPQLEARGANQQTAQVAVQETGALQTRLADLETKRANLGEAEAEFAEIAAQFPHDYEQPDWLTLVYRAADRAEVTVTSIDPGVPVDPAYINPQTGQPIPQPEGVNETGDFPIAVSKVQVAAQGTTENLTAFVRALENLSRPLLISDLEVSGNDETSGLVLRGSVFLTRPMERPGDPAADSATAEPSA